MARTEEISDAPRSLIHQRRASPSGESHAVKDAEDRYANTKNDEDVKESVARLLFFLVVVIGLRVLSSREPVIDPGTILKSMSADGLSLDVDPNAKLFVDFDKNDGGISLGPHKVSFVVTPSCRSPGFWMRVEGDALVGVNLREESSLWTGSFSLPFAGEYHLAAYWYGCDGKGPKQVVNVQDMTIKSVGSWSSQFPEADWVTDAVWVSSKKFPQSGALTINQEYLWLNPKVTTASGTLLKLQETTVAKEGTIGEQGTYQFDKLSNYELVCFFGSESAAKLHNTFLELRGSVSVNQRPFKFHYYPSHSFVKPASEWSVDKEKGFRKCKHILVSMDEVHAPATQKSFRSQVETFLLHLHKAFPDETFPIWMFTITEPPSQATNCHNPSLPRTSDHPCNDALRDLFAGGALPSRIRLMDNADLSLPQLGEHKNDVLAVIALRVFTLVGKKVEEWRNNRQNGNIKGLQRGDVLEPNFELVPYEGWK